MTVLAQELSQDGAVRCSAWAQSAGLDPIGTVGSYSGYVLVETPLPWPRDVGEMPLLAGLQLPPGFRLQALVPTSMEAPAADRQVIVHRRRDDGPFAGYHRTSVVGGASLAAAVASVLSPGAADSAGVAEAAGSGSAGSAAAGAGSADSVEAGAGSAGSAGSVAAGAGSAGSVEAGVVDLLVCTHGRRDVCCGSKGTDLAMQLLALGPRRGVNLRRTSHTGGHRFAPTFLLLPQGTAWAFASVELVEQVLDRSVPFAAIAPHYRGCAGLSSPQVQAVERAVLCEVGWELLDRPRLGSATGETTSDGGTVVRLDAGSDKWEAVVRAGRTLPVPDCMKPLSEAKKTETEVVVSSLRSV